MEIAWFCDRGTEKDVWKKDENKENEVEEVVQVVRGKCGECDSGWKGGVGGKKEGEARWKVVLSKRPTEGGSTAPTEYVGDEQSEEVNEKEETRGESCETTEAVGEGTQRYEDFDESGQSDTIVVLSEENEDVFHISIGIAMKAMKFGGIREDRIVVIV